MPQTESIEKLTREGVIALNKIWDADGWTNNAIVQYLEDNKVSGSLSTIQRLRKEGAENQKYNYNQTIKPMLRVFAGISDKPVSVADAKSVEDVRIATLQNTILMRETDIKVLMAQNEALEKENSVLEERLAETKAESKRKIDNLLGQVEREIKNGELTHRYMGERADFLRQKDTQIGELTTENSELKKQMSKLQTESKKELKAQKKISRHIFWAWMFTLSLLIVALFSDSILRIL